jgi:hypothetical protein
MASDELLEIYRQLRTSQDKYIYFILAAAASAVAFALVRTQDLPLSFRLVPWGLALFLWGLSFFCGCQHLRYVSSTLFSNAELLRIQRGQHPQVGAHPEMIAAASEGIKSAMEYNSERANILAKRQFYLFIAGALAYVAWHVLQMYARTT